MTKKENLAIELKNESENANAREEETILMIGKKNLIQVILEVERIPNLFLESM